MGKVKLTDICSPKQWKTIPTEQLTEDGYPVYGANGIIGKYSEYNHANPVIAITCRGATCGNINITQEKAYVTGNAMCLDDLCSDVDLEYLFYALRHYDFSTVISGSAQPQITRQGLSKVSVQLFPDDHQKFIAKTLAKAERIISHRRTQLAKLDELVKCRFVEMFGTCTMVKTIKDCNFFISDGNYSSKYPRSEEFVSVGVPFIRANNIKNGTVIDDELYYITESKHAILRKGHLKANDLLITTRGNTGQTAIVPFRHQDSNINAQIVLIRVMDGMMAPIYLREALNALEVQEQIKKLETGTALKQLPVGNLLKIKIRVPDMSQQNAFAAFVLRIDKLRFVIQQSLDEAQKLFDSLMQKYFD